MKRIQKMENTQIEFAEGKEKALELAIDKYGQAILRYCHNILCDYYEAQDATQITFIKAYNKRATYDFQKQLASWLYKIAYNTCIDIIRKRKRVKFTEIIPSQQEKDNYMPENIKNALMTLNGLDRALVYGRVMEEKSYAELATIHGKSEAALRKRYERAKKCLAAILEDDYPSYAGSASKSTNDKSEELI